MLRATSINYAKMRPRMLILKHDSINSFDSKKSLDTAMLLTGMRTIHSLGHCCNNMISAHKKIQQGMRVDYNLSQDSIGRLKDIGFKWKSVNYDEAV